MDEAAGEGGGEEGEEEHTEQQSQRIQVATARTLDFGAVREIYRGDILGPPPPPPHHHKGGAGSSAQVGWFLKKWRRGRSKEEEERQLGVAPPCCADDSLNSKPRTYRIHVNLDTRIFLKTCTKEFVSVCL